MPSPQSMVSTMPSAAATRSIAMVADDDRPIRRPPVSTSELGRPLILVFPGSRRRSSAPNPPVRTSFAAAPHERDGRRGAGGRGAIEHRLLGRRGSASPSAADRCRLRQAGRRSPTRRERQRWREATAVTDGFAIRPTSRLSAPTSVQIQPFPVPPTTLSSPRLPPSRSALEPPARTSFPLRPTKQIRPSPPSIQSAPIPPTTRSSGFACEHSRHRRVSTLTASFPSPPCTRRLSLRAQGCSRQPTQSRSSR